MRVVARSVLEMGLDAPVVVATDDQRVIDAVSGLEVEPLMTDPAHRSGTERVADVADLAQYREAEIIVNVQGDEPLLPAEAVIGAVDMVHRGYPIGTAAARMAHGAIEDPERVKVVIDVDGRAMRFSRPYPSFRSWGARVDVMQHIGVYAYTRDAIERWVRLPELDAERHERLEQLRPLRAGISIGVARLEQFAPPSIDTVDDLVRAETLLGAIR